MLSIMDGTWSSGAAPQEYVEWRLMKEMRLSWEELQRTPVYVQTYCWDFIMAEARERNSRNDEQQRAMQATPGVRRVRR